MNSIDERIRSILRVWNPRLASIRHEPRIAAYYVNMELLNWQLRDLGQYCPDKNSLYELEPL